MKHSTWPEDGSLRFALGIEDTFVPQTKPGQRSLDEYDLMQHYTKWEEDIELTAQSGATMLRWGIPWYRVNPGKGKWDWSWVDRVIDKMNELGVELIVDLVHYGTPLWLDNEFANADYPNYVAEYGAAVADRYKNRIRYYTPVNEPLLNTMYCGEFGHWPPYLTGDFGFVTILRQLSRGIVKTQSSIASVNPSAKFIHVEASFRFSGAIDKHPATHEHLANRAYIVQDLVTGHVQNDHPLTTYLLENGFSEADLAWAIDNTAQPDVVGVNYYPQHSTEIFVEGADPGGGPGDLRPRVNAGTEGLKDVLTNYAERYQKPVFLTETGYTGTDEERIQWLKQSVTAVRELRQNNVNIVGYTWWSLTDMFEWTYRYGDKHARNYMLAMGLWALEEDTEGILNRRKTPAADVFNKLANGTL